MEGAAPAALPLRKAPGARQDQAAGDDRSGPRARWLRLGRRRRDGEAAAPVTHGGRRLRRDLVEQSKRHRGGPRKGGSSAALCDRASARTRAISPRQLPTDHDHDGEPRARFANIRVINRRARRPAAAPLHLIFQEDTGGGLTGRSISARFCRLRPSLTSRIFYSSRAQQGCATPLRRARRKGLNDRRDGAGDTKLDTRRVGACQPDRYAAGSRR